MFSFISNFFKQICFLESITRRESTIFGRLALTCSMLKRQYFGF